MKTNHIRLFSLLCACCLMMACKQREVSFTFSPETPRAGQSILFSNLTSEGEKWDWTFGDGTSAASKNPSKVYKRPGTYTVVLTVDGKANLRYSKTLTVIDTVPSIRLAEDSLVYYMTPVKLQMSAYNPYSYDKTYSWKLAPEVLLVEGDTTDEYITVLFTQHSKTFSVGCTLTIGDNIYECEQSFYVCDKEAPALLMTTADHQLLIQRLFTTGEEEPLQKLQDPAALSLTASLAINKDTLYLFNADSTANAAIYGYDLALAGSPVRLVYNEVTGSNQGFRNGLCLNNMLYWTSPKDGIIFRAGTTVRDIPYQATLSSALHWGSISELHYPSTAGAVTSGLAVFNDYFLLGYDKGIYRFLEDDLHRDQEPQAGAILTDRAITRFALDPLAKKVYFTTSEGLHVCNFSGDNVRLIRATANGKGLCIDNAMNRLYWTEDNGVYYMPLIASANNASAGQPVLLNNQNNILAIAVDHTPRYCSVHNLDKE